MDGASWLQTQLLKNPAAPLRVYAVWVPMPLIVPRDAWNATFLPDLRVTHFWDGNQVLSQWFAKEADSYRYGEVSWDMYYLYGPDAVWRTVPTPLVDSGGTIYRKRDQLEKQIDALLQDAK